MKISKKHRVRLRSLVQLAFFVWVLLIVLVSEAVERGWNLPFEVKTASLHALCPFGGIVTLYNLVKTGVLIKKIHDSAVVLAALGVALAILFGPVICGWICPLGTFQEWIGRLGRKIFKRKYNTFVPAKVDRVLRLLRYVVLVWVLVMTALSATLVFQAYDPYYALFSFIHGEVAIGGLVILIIIMLLALVVERPFCKYVCPYGAFLGLFNRIRIFKIRRVASTCINCSACNRACPMNIDVAHKETVKDAQCISCMECTSDASCPVEKTVVFSPAKRGRHLSQNKVGLLTVAILIGGILLSVAFGLWKTSSTKQPALIKSGSFAGMPNPADIRGSYTYQDVTNAFAVPVEVLLAAFQSQNGAQRLGDLEELWLANIPAGTEVGTDSVRLFVALYTGIDFEAEEGTLLPTSAIEVLEQVQKTSDPRFAELKASAVALPEGLEVAPSVGTTSVSITGKTTVQDLINAGYSFSDLEKILGKVDNKLSAVKTLAESKGLDFSAVKAEIAAL